VKTAIPNFIYASVCADPGATDTTGPKCMWKIWVIKHHRR